VSLDSKAVLHRHGRSFALAGRFLPPDRLDDAALLYHFCRLVDDTADEADTEEDARAGLAQLRGELTGALDAGALVGAFLDLAERRAVPVDAALELITGVQSDLGTVRMQSDAELLRYCYRVAGTVGLMMCGVLGVDDPKAWPHAVDLGVAMQLTNISRDVLEDAGLGRVYVPIDRLRRHGGDPDALLALPVQVPRPEHPLAAPCALDTRPVQRTVADLVELADAYYRSGWSGMHHIPLRSRMAICVASRVYRAIGRRLLRRGGDPMRGRMVVPPWEKATQVAIGLWTLPLGLAPAAHKSELHHALAGLPGCASSQEIPCLSA
jgi:phytoene synthase